MERGEAEQNIPNFQNITFSVGAFQNRTQNGQEKGSKMGYGHSRWPRRPATPKRLPRYLLGQENPATTKETRPASNRGRGSNGDQRGPKKGIWQVGGNKEGEGRKGRGTIGTGGA